MKIQLRHDDASAWTLANPVLDKGEFGVEDDTGKFKVGDGVKVWTDLSYFKGGLLTGASNISVVSAMPVDPDPDTLYITTT
jgi:hypothetical protein